MFYETKEIKKIYDIAAGLDRWVQKLPFCNNYKSIERQFKFDKSER